MSAAVTRMCVVVVATAVVLTACGDPEATGGDIGAEGSTTSAPVAEPSPSTQPPATSTTALDQECLHEWFMIDTAVITYQRRHDAYPPGLDVLIADGSLDPSVDLSRWAYSAQADDYILDGPCSWERRGPTTTLEGL